MRSPRGGAGYKYRLKFVRQNPYTFRPQEAHPQSGISFYEIIEVKAYKYFRKRKPRKWIRVPENFYERWVVVLPDAPQRRKIKRVRGWIPAYKAEEMERRLLEQEHPIQHIRGHYQHTNRWKDWFFIKDRFVYYRRFLPLRIKLGLARVWFWVLIKKGLSSGDYESKEKHYELWVYTFSTRRRAYFPKYQEMKNHILNEEVPALLDDLKEHYNYIENAWFSAWSAWAGMQKIPYHRVKK